MKKNLFMINNKSDFIEKLFFLDKNKKIDLEQK